MVPVEGQPDDRRPGTRTALLLLGLGASELLAEALADIGDDLGNHGRGCGFADRSYRFRVGPRKLSSRQHVDWTLLEKRGRIRGRE